MRRPADFPCVSVTSTLTPLRGGGRSLRPPQTSATARSLLGALPMSWTNQPSGTCSGGPGITMRKPARLRASRGLTCSPRSRPLAGLIGGMRSTKTRPRPCSPAVTAAAMPAVASSTAKASTSMRRRVRRGRCRASSRRLTDDTRSGVGGNESSRPQAASASSRLRSGTCASRGRIELAAQPFEGAREP